MSASVIAQSTVDYSEMNDGDAFRAPLNVIDPFPGGNIRKSRNPDSFSQLRAAIRTANGVTQGVTVRANPDDSSRLQLLAGYGRYEASALEGFSDIPVVLKVVSDKEAEAIMLSENLDREDLSIADEIVAAQKFVSHFDGNYSEAAKQLNWSEHRLRGRLALNQCSDNVLEALRKGEIGLGHAEILSAFVPKLQDGTLEKIIDEKWSLEYLKERAGKANRLLKTAIFDTTDCDSCPHNSSLQSELFDNTVGRARCNNLVCFKDKTDLKLAERKAELEDEYGVVLLAIEKPESDRNLVNSEVVGSEQFSTGCTGCSSKVVILKDGINKDSGQYLTDQCIDSDCFRKMKQANDDALLPKPAKPKTQAATKAKPGASSAASSAKKPKAAEQKTPSAVIEQNKELLRSLSAAHFECDSHLMDALSTASMIDKGGAIDIKGALKKSLDISLPNDFNDMVLHLYGLDAAMLTNVRNSAFAHYLGKAGDNHQSYSAHPRDLAIKALAGDSQGKAIAVSGWKPSKELLKKYIAGSLVVMANKSGFSSEYDKQHGEGTFAKLTKKSKGQLIDGMLEFDFDWSQYAPDDYLKCLV